MTLRATSRREVFYREDDLTRAARLASSTADKTRQEGRCNSGRKATIKLMWGLQRVPLWGWLGIFVGISLASLATGAIPIDFAPWFVGLAVFGGFSAWSFMRFLALMERGIDRGLTYLFDVEGVRRASRLRRETLWFLGSIAAALFVGYAALLQRHSERLYSAPELSDWAYLITVVVSVVVAVRTVVWAIQHRRESPMLVSLIAACGFGCFWIAAGTDYDGPFDFTAGQWRVLGTALLAGAAAYYLRVFPAVRR